MSGVWTRKAQGAPQEDDSAVREWELWAQEAGGVVLPERSPVPAQSPPGSQQLGGDPVGLDKTKECSLTEEVSAAQDTTDGPAEGG